MASTLPLILGAAFLSLGFLALVLGLRSLGWNEMDRRLNVFVGSETVQAPVRVQTLTMRRNELSGNFQTRVLQPWFKGLGNLLGRFTPSPGLSDLELKLVIAGNPGGLGAREFYGFRLLLNIGGIVAAFLVLRQGAGASAQDDRQQRDDNAQAGHRTLQRLRADAGEG